MNQEGSPDRRRIKPDRAQRDRTALPLDSRRNKRPPWGHQDLLLDGLASLDLDDFLTNLAGLKPVGGTNTGSVRSELLDEKIGVIDQPGRNPPGSVAIVSDADSGRADQGGACHGPLRSPDMKQVPGSREGGREVRIVGQDRPTACRP